MSSMFGRYFILFFFSLLLFSCSRNESELLRVAAPLPSGAVTSDTPIRITFSKAVVRPESVSVWTSSPFIQFTPPISGKFIWQDTATLVFSPDSILRGDTKYHAELNTSLLIRYAGMKSFDGEDKFDFSTEAFRLRTAEFFYDRLSENRMVGIKANLEFSYAVRPADVQKYLKLNVDGVSLSNAIVMSQTIGKVIPIELGVVQQTENKKTISVDFDPSFTSVETGTSIRTEKPFTFSLPGIGDLSVYGHDFVMDANNGTITFSMSQEVDSTNAREFIEINPPRQFTLSGTRNSFTIHSTFEPGSTFSVTLKKGLTSTLNAKLKNDYEAEIIAGNVKPTFNFASTAGSYMLLSGDKKLEIKSVNVPKIFVRISQIFQNNIVHFLVRGRYLNWEYYESDYSDEEEGSYVSGNAKYRYEVGNFGRTVWENTLTIQGQPNREVATMLDLHPHIRTDYKGFYLVEIADISQPWNSTAKLISISNIGMIVKESADEFLVFTTNLATAKPMSGVTVNIISNNNQTVASMKSDNDGVARFGNKVKIQQDFSINLITAQIDSDFNFIKLSDYAVETSRFDVSGKYENENQYDVFLYGDRNLYRPGETIHISGIIRKIGSAVPASLPVKLEMTSPTGTKIKELQQKLNSEGSFELSFPTLPTALTGSYNFNLRTMNDVYLASYSVSIEDFVPDRLKISMKADKESALPGEKIAYQIEAFNFFGPPAVGRNYEFEGSFEPIPFYSKRFRDYSFGDKEAKAYKGNPVILTGKTNEQGKATARLDIPTTVTSSGVVKAKGKVAVFDESGRPVYQIAATTVFPKTYFIGLKNLSPYYIAPGSQQKLKIVAVDQKDSPIEGFKAKIEIIRKEWHSVLRQYSSSGSLRYVSEQREIIEETKVITLGKEPIELPYSVKRSGDYLIRVSKDGDTGYNQCSFYAYSWGTSDITSFSINPEAQVEIVLDDSSYRPGEKAKALFKTPFNGTMLVTIERNSVYSYRYIDVVNNAASMEIPIEEKYLPNVYISAVLFRKITGEQLPLLAGHGMKPIFVEQPSNKLQVTISAPEKIRPKTKQAVTIKAGREQNIFVTLAAVDEGILQLKNYATPNPYQFFFARKALQTVTYDFFKDLIPELTKSKTGGSDADLAQKVNPLGVMRFKPLALWSGILKTNSNGEAVATLDVPEFSGELRLMALAYKGERFGSAQKGMKVADPVVLTPSLPRFLSPNDSIAMTVTAFNTTDKPVTLTLEVETTGGITAISKSATLEVGANQERFATLPMKATMQIGKATVKVRTKAFGETIESVTELPVRPVAPFISEAISHYVDGGKTVTDSVSNAFLPYGKKAYITLSPFPVANFAKELKDLIGYPYGCLEQTTSKAFPQIYLRDIAMLLDPSILSKGSPAYYVNEAITKIASQQLASGKFSYWPGEQESYPWTTVYATHFLVEAKKAGYVVPEATVQSALNALRNIARSRSTDHYVTYGAGKKVTSRVIADKSVLYALYVLAVAGAPENPVMNYYRTEKSLLTNDTRYLLSAAFALSGDRRTSIELAPPEFATENPEQETGGSFDSPIRSNALILNILLESDYNNPKIPMYMNYLSKTYKEERWHSTQENAFTLLAFGKAARLASTAKMQGTIKVGLKEIAYNGGNQKFDIDPFGKKINITIRGEGRTYYSIVTSGIRTDGKIPVGDKILQIRREFFRRDGSQTELGTVRQNELIIVKLTLKSSLERIENIAITDMLPAGFEIENPRLTDNTRYSFIENASIPQYMDIRDDRINIYTSFDYRNSKTFYYMMRAVTVGAFEYPPVTAEAMYNPDFYSGYGGMKIKVVR